MDSHFRQILVAESDPHLRQQLSAYLSASGYQVSEASDADEALHLARRECPHFLIASEKLANGNGMELCQRIRESILPHYVYMILLTEQEGDNTRLAGLKSGADDVLPQPWDHEELLWRLWTADRILARERRLSELAMTDALTGIPNRLRFTEALAREFERALRHQAPLSCVLIDLDHFKTINDLHGHAVGDAAIKAVGLLLSSHSRVWDHVCRFGGEEFCVVLPETSAEEAVRWGERMRASITNLDVRAGSGSVNVSASFGVASRDEGTRSVKDMLARADDALRSAKQAGRDRVWHASWRKDAGNHSQGEVARAFDPFADKQARDIMMCPIITLNESDTVATAADYFLRMRVNSLPIVNDVGLLTGIISEKDLMILDLVGDAWKTPVRQVMKTNVVSYEENTPARIVYEFLCRLTIRRVIVVHQGKPVGVISRGSILRWFGNWGEIREYLPREERLASEEFHHRRSKSLLVEWVQRLATQVSELQRTVAMDEFDFVPSVVDHATRIQELTNDLLASTQIHYFAAADSVRGIPPLPVPPVVSSPETPDDASRR